MISMLLRRAAGAIVAGLALIAGCSSGGGSVSIRITLQSVDPTTSSDLNGGDTVTIFGSGFNSVLLAQVTFGGRLSFGIMPGGDNMFTVTSPPAPGGNPGTVTIEVTYLTDGVLRTVGLFGAYTYIDVAQPPSPQSITPRNYTATGAGNFTIQGTNLGPPGGTTQVNFLGIGIVTASVSQDGQFLTGAAPVSPGAPVQVPVTVRVEPVGGNPVNVPTTVNFLWTPPVAIPLGNQTRANASQPVKLADGFAVLCTAGTDAAWGNGNDSIVIISGPPNAVGVLTLGGLSLSATNSIPAVMDANTFCVYSIGADGAVGTNDDSIVHVSAAQTATPVVTNIVHAFLNSAPLVAIASNRIATTGAGVDTLRGTIDDEIVIVTFTGAAANIQVRPNAGRMDFAGGSGAWSQPISFDGENVYVPTLGADGLPMTADDLLSRVQVSQLPGGGFLSVSAPFLAGRPIALGNTRLAAPAGVGGAAGGVNDVLMVFDDSGGAINRFLHTLNTRTIVGAPRAFVPFGNGGIAVAHAGVDMQLASGDERIRCYLDPLNNVFNDIPMLGRSSISALGGGTIIFWDTTFSAFFIDVLASFNPPPPFFPSPLWNLAFAPLADATRAFAVDAGADTIPDTGDENLIVQQSTSIFSAGGGSTLPLAMSLSTRLTGQQPFVPIGPGWGLIQSAGPNGTIGNGDDQLILAYY